ncbi:hypothetical protein OHS33_36435 [Streptomyces sp. NBC_00536]|uniref:hypothetical protein n=1 Tax=Streptomyces sp. NBC_00536 TaxID=2975769 RepID=UPI002E7FC11B|nr:hypothetical protein [Streptomyces sp. NBC_00536]WUC83379.1 hypothetical protein OHS33_36435 [Streptomyces sp. NBC_00536]
MPVRARLRAAVAALGLTAALVTIPVEAAHADSCPNPIPLSVSDVVLRVNTGMGRHVDHTIGKIYLSYIGGTCRQQFAEIHWNTGAERASGTLYINDPFNSEVGRVPFNVQANYTGYTTSGGISIDHDPWGTTYPQPKAFQAAAHINIDDNFCSTTIATAAHLYSTGGTSGTSSTTCATGM